MRVKCSLPPILEESNFTSLSLFLPFPGAPTVPTHPHSCPHGTRPAHGGVVEGGVSTSTGASAAVPFSFSFSLSSG